MIQNQPLVTVVMCTYNGEKFLRQQLESVLSQTYSHIEIIICDDGSSDNTISIVTEFASRDNRINIHKNPITLGYNKNFEQAFGKASGEFIAVCDQDDIWKPEKIKKMLSLFSDEEIMLVHAQSVRFTHEVPEVSSYAARRSFEGHDVRQLMFFNTIAGHNILFRKGLLQNRPAFPDGVFYDWWLTVLAAVFGSIAATEEVLTFHRFHTDNLTLGKKDEGKQTKQKARERLHTINAILEIEQLKEEERSFAIQMKSALATLQQKKFSPLLMMFLARHANTIFFFKKKSILSRLKMAYRMSFALS